MQIIFKVAYVPQEKILLTEISVVNLMESFFIHIAPYPDTSAEKLTSRFVKSEASYQPNYPIKPRKIRGFHRSLNPDISM